MPRAVEGSVGIDEEMIGLSGHVHPSSCPRFMALSPDQGPIPIDVDGAVREEEIATGLKGTAVE